MLVLYVDMTATSESRIRQKFTGESDEKEPAAVRADSRSSQHELDRAPAPDATPHRFATSRAQTRRDQASQSHPGRTHSYKKANQKKKKVASALPNDSGEKARDAPDTPQSLRPEPRLEPYLAHEPSVQSGVGPQFFFCQRRSGWRR